MLSLLLAQQTLTLGQLDGGRGVLGLGFIHDILAVGFNGAFAGKQFQSNFSVGQALRHQVQHFHFVLA